MAEFSIKAYEAAIPPCCSVQTVEGHIDMLLCWGLSAALEAGKPMDCTGCDLRKPLEHQWADPRGPIKWPHCSVCGIIRRADGKNSPCKGPVTVRPRDQL